MQLKENQILLLAGAALLLYILYKEGAFQKRGEIGYTLDPTEGNSDNSAPTISEAAAKNKAISFRNSMLNNSFSSDIFEEACNSLLALSDADLKVVSNHYNNLFKNEEYKTLRAVLNQEYTFWASSTKLRNDLNKRLTEIGA